MRRPLCLLCMFYVGILMLVLRLFPLQDSMNLPQDGAYIVCSGEVSAVENQDDKSVVYLKSAFIVDSSAAAKQILSSEQSAMLSETSDTSDEAKADACQVICYFQNSSFASKLKIGNRVRISGKCRLFHSAANDGQFDAKQYYRILEFDFAMSGCKGIVTDENVRTFDQALYQIRERLAQSFDRGLDAADSGVMKAMLLGQKSGLDDEIKGLYQRSGIAHILAISGVKTENLAIPLSATKPVNTVFLPIHSAKKYIQKLCFSGEITPRCRFPCPRG